MNDLDAPGRSHQRGQGEFSAARLENVTVAGMFFKGLLMSATLGPLAGLTVNMLAGMIRQGMENGAYAPDGGMRYVGSGLVILQVLLYGYALVLAGVALFDATRTRGEPRTKCLAAAAGLAFFPVLAIIVVCLVRK